MGVSPSFIEFIKDQLAGFGPVSARRMFGGAGICRDGVMFGLIADDALYFKADDVTRPDFEAEELGPFVYTTKTGTNTLTSYWRVPERCFDDPGEMAEWAGKAHAAALRARKP